MNKSVSNTMEKRRINTERIGYLAKGAIICILGFMIGRGVIEGISPMLVAYYGCVFENKKMRIWGFLSTVLGLVSAQTVPNIFKYLAIIISITVLGTIIEFLYKKNIGNLMGVICTVSTIIVAIGAPFYFKFDHLSGITIILEGASVFLLTILFRKGMSFLTDMNKEGVVKETFISFSILACAATLGMMGITVIQISLLQLIALNLLLHIGFQYGVEASSIMGVAIGLAAYYAKAEGVVDEFIIWSILGVVAGLFREIGKVGTAIAYFSAFLVLTLLYGPKGVDLKTMEMLILTIGLFLILPTHKKERIIQKDAVEENELEKMIHLRLNRFALTYENIAKRFVRVKPLQEQLTNNEINQLIDHVADKVCKDCSMCNMCWQKDFYDTYRAVYSVLSAVESKGEVMVEDIPVEFYKQCLKVDEFVIMVNRVFEIYKTNLRWENKMIEHRGLFADQFLNISNIIKDLSESVSKSREEQGTFLKRIKSELGHLDVVNVLMDYSANEREEIVIDVKSGKDMGFIKELLKTINKIGPNRFSIKEVESIPQIGIKRCVFTEKETYRLVKGYASIHKNEQPVSGDCFTFIDLEGGRDIIALSDGMGSGEQALVESKATIEMLEQLVEGGFDIDVAIKTVNSILGIRNNHQAFATLDISMVDRYTGECSFIKNGAVSTYLKRGQHIEKIKTDTLPLGMFKEIEFSALKRRLKGDDIVIMMSDGISDLPYDKDDNTLWLEELIEQVDSLNPQKIADLILDVAKDRAGGSAPDDMTVLVFRVWEKGGN
ncbi:MAG: stage II sporulation protein E [Firmicutes bacterium HGW-Firmicutes-1]|jgi:stage II sporulation protein E|nr:MAG: stage II sporulation protein E [Firmicutes bacterium HGW-Firmicutes-1]